MRKIKQFAALFLSLSVSINLCGCKTEIKRNTETFSSHEDSSHTVTSDSADSDTQDDSYAESAAETESAEQVQTDVSKDLEELVFLGDTDITSPDSEEYDLYGIDLFENAGGKIRYEKCSQSEIYDKLTEEELAKNQIDAVLYDNEMAYPYACVNNIFQPIDSVVDFDSSLWKDVKSAADRFELNGWHYTAPASVTPSVLFYYSKSAVERLGADDPTELYSQGKWDWSAWESMVRSYGGDGKYGVGGDYARAVFLSTGKTIVRFEKSSESFVTDIFSADLANAAELLYGLKNDGICYDGSAEIGDCTDGKLLFYVGDSDLIGSVDEDIAAVPPPCSPQADESYMQAKITAFMWVNGSDKAEEFKLLLECSRQAGSERMAEFPYFSDDNAVYDFSGGISDKLSDPAQNSEFGAAVIPFIYSAPCEYGEWDSICAYFSNALTVELSILNNQYAGKTYN